LIIDYSIKKRVVQINEEIVYQAIEDINEMTLKTPSDMKK
jgi:hypothetical protein